MKNYFVKNLIIILGLSIILAGCKKEKGEIAFYTEKEIHNNSLKEFETKLAWYGCEKVVEGECKPGITCDVTTFTEECYEAKECAVVAEEALGEFTEFELANWVEGFDVLLQNTNFIENHYNFYLYLFENENGTHPDSILGNLRSGVAEYWEPAPCVLSDGSVGVECRDSQWEHCSCPKNTECKAVEGEALTEFTQEEIDAWQNGNLEFGTDDGFINDHYQFYLHIGKKKLCYHPDWLIENSN